MKSIPILTIKGITTYIHPTWFVYVAIIFAITGFKLLVLGAIALVFSIVVIHEYGHSLYAKMVYNINVKRITLIPFGGVALIGKIEPGWKELWITVAGPATNLVMWLVGTFMLMPLMPDEGFATITLGFFNQVNLVLLLFNIVPIFPMDGGRITRSLLYLGTKNVVLSTRIAYYGGLLSTLIVLQFLGFPIWVVLILVFIALSGHQELKMIERKFGKD